MSARPRGLCVGLAVGLVSSASVACFLSPCGDSPCSQGWFSLYVVGTAPLSDEHLADRVTTEPPVLVVRVEDDEAGLVLVLRGELDWVEGEGFHLVGTPGTDFGDPCTRPDLVSFGLEVPDSWDASVDADFPVRTYEPVWGGYDEVELWHGLKVEVQNDTWVC